jgi:hypothetical protein
MSGMVIPPGSVDAEPDLLVVAEPAAVVAGAAFVVAVAALVVVALSVVDDSLSLLQAVRPTRAVAATSPAIIR